MVRIFELPEGTTEDGINYFEKYDIHTIWCEVCGLNTHRLYMNDEGRLYWYCWGEPEVVPSGYGLMIVCREKI